MAKTILLADDSITIQKIVSLTFSGEGVEVVSVGNGDAALKKVYEIRPELVLADIFMPGKNGYEVCEHIKNDPGLAHLPVILLVGAFEPFDSNEATRVKASGHLTKPFEIKVLISAVNSLINAAEQEKSSGTVQQDSIESEAPRVGGSTSHFAEDALPRVEGVAQDPVTPHVSEPPIAVSPPPLISEPVPTPSAFSKEGGHEAFMPEAVQKQHKVLEISTTQEPKRAEEPRPGTPSILLEDLDPLGLDATDPIAGIPPLDGEGSLELKSLVIDVWEPRPASVPDCDLFTELASTQEEIPLNVASSQAEPMQSADEDRSPESLTSSFELTEGEVAQPVTSHSNSGLDISVEEEPRTNGKVVPTAELFQSNLEKTPFDWKLDQPELIDLIANKVVERLSKEVIEKIAWEVIPDLAEMMIKEHLESHLKDVGKM
jgi:CheY-like chemotaxis protein